MPGLKDEMKIDDLDVQASIKCAQCGEPVQPGESHKCKEGEKKDESSN